LLVASLQALARGGSRQRQEFLVIEEGVLAAWAEQHGLSRRQAYQKALAAGIFPESLERNFPTLSIQEQLQLCRSRVLVVGLGGLGGYQAQLLGRLGVGSLLLADGDRFAPTNLNRQLLATESSLGQSKAFITAEFLRSINPALEAHPLEEYLNAANYASYLHQVDLALDGLDTLSARRELLAAARETGKPVIHGAVLGQDGQVTTILPADDPAFESRHLSQASPTVEPPPVLAPIVSLVASLQVQEALRLLRGHPPAYHGRLAYLDGDTGRLEFFPL
jgi:molybdopterin/thiamine biosynthesis adenylyltransferase